VGVIIYMNNDNVLVEQEFEIPLGGQTHKVKATAAFLGGGFVLTTGGMKEEGSYLLNFTLRGQHAEMFQPDKNRYSREEAKRVAERAFASGQVEAHVRRQLQGWIYLGL
jgi:hypothetical protein